MNYNHLYYFYVTVREGGVSAASRALSVSQPSLSSQIKTLEDFLNIQLFERQGRKLVLTSAGRLAYTRAAQMFDHSQALIEDLKQSTSGGTPVKIGVADEVERPFSVNLIRDFFDLWKGPSQPIVNLSTGENDQLISSLRSWSYDAILSNRPTIHEDVEVVGTLEMPVYLTMAPAYLTIKTDKRARTRAISCTAREVSQFLGKQKKGLAIPSDRLKLRGETDSFLSRQQPKLPITFESDTLATIVRAITDGVGIGFLPLPYFARDVLRGDLVVLGPPEGLWNHVLYLLARRERRSSPILQSLAKAFDRLKDEMDFELKKIRFLKARFD